MIEVIVVHLLRPGQVTALAPHLTEAESAEIGAVGDRYIAGGMSEPEARFRALVESGKVDKIHVAPDVAERLGLKP